jgi:hypothetical protein
VALTRATSSVWMGAGKALAVKDRDSVLPRRRRARLQYRTTELDGPNPSDDFHRGGCDTRTPLAVVARDTHRGTTMTTGRFVRRSGWDATHYDLSLRGIQQFRRSAAAVRPVVACSAQRLEKP